MLMRQKQCKQTDSHVRAVNPRDRARQSLLQQACKNKTWTMNCRIMRISMMQINAILGGFSWLRNSKTPDIACTSFNQMVSNSLIIRGREIEDLKGNRKAKDFSLCSVFYPLF